MSVFWDRGLSVSWEGCHSKAWWAHQPVAVGQCLFVVPQPEGSFASCPPFRWLQAARVVQDLEGQPGQDWSPAERLPDPKLHLLGQCQLWLLCFIFHVAILLSWQPRTAPLKKDQERQPVNKLKDGKQRSLHLLARGSVFFAFTNSLWQLQGLFLHILENITLNICKHIYIHTHLLALSIGNLFPKSCTTRKPFRHWNAPYKGKSSSDAPPPIDLDPPQSLGLHSFSKCMCKLFLAGKHSMQQLLGICLTNCA